MPLPKCTIGRGIIPYSHFALDGAIASIYGPTSAHGSWRCRTRLKFSLSICCVRCRGYSHGQTPMWERGRRAGASTSVHGYRNTGSMCVRSGPGRVECSIHSGNARSLARTRTWRLQSSSRAGGFLPDVTFRHAVQGRSGGPSSGRCLNLRRKGSRKGHRKNPDLHPRRKQFRDPKDIPPPPSAITHRICSCLGPTGCRRDLTIR